MYKRILEPYYLSKGVSRIEAKKCSQSVYGLTIEIS